MERFICKGDEVLVRLEVAENSYRRLTLKVPGEDGGLININGKVKPNTLIYHGSVVSHYPTLKHIEVGDEIPGPAIGGDLDSYVVKGVDADTVWFGGHHVVSLKVIQDWQASQPDR